MRTRSSLLAGLAGAVLLTGSAFAAADSAFVDAAKAGDATAVRAALAAGTDANRAAPDGTTALLWAAHNGDAMLIDALLRAGADVHHANEYGATALYEAAANAETDAVVKLLAAGARPNQALLSGETPLMEASRRGRLATVNLLLAAKADPNAKESKGGQTALMWAASERHGAVSEALIRGGADIKARSRSGFTALMFAAQQGDAVSARALLAAGADVNEAMPGTLLTPLIIASAMNRPEVATLLLEKGADPNAVDGEGFTSLHYAVRDKKAVPIVAALLAHRANPNARLAQKKITAVQENQVEMQGATPLLYAAEINNYDAVVALIDAGADIGVTTEKGTTALILAAGGGTDLARPRPPEERAMAVRTVAYLLEHGADIDAHGQFGWTALHAASYQGLDEVIVFLAGKGAKLDAMDGFGQTALSISQALITEGLGAAYYQAPRIYRRETGDLLVKLGATPLERSGVRVVTRRAVE